MRRILFLAVGLFWLVASSAAGAAELSVRAAVEKANKEFIAAFNGGDAAKVGSFYTDDATALPPGAEAVKGNQAIREFWAGAIKGGFGDLVLTTASVDSRSVLAYEVGTYSLTAPGQGGQKATVKGNYVVVWKRQPGGVWRIHVDIWN